MNRQPPAPTDPAFTPRQAPAQGPILAALLLAVTLATLAACMPAQRPNTFELLTGVESTLSTAARTLSQALTLGTITPADADYATAYAALERAGTIMDAAWRAYRAGELGQAELLRDNALDAYLAVRPIINQLAGG